MIRQDMTDPQALPPRPFLEQVMDGVSKVYCWLWDKKDPECRYDGTWKEITQVHSKTAFKSSVRKLGAQGLLSFSEDEQGIHIELVGWDDVMDYLDDEA